MKTTSASAGKTTFVVHTFAIHVGSSDFSQKRVNNLSDCKGVFVL